MKDRAPTVIFFLKTIVHGRLAGYLFSQWQNGTCPTRGKALNLTLCTLFCEAYVGLLDDNSTSGNDTNAALLHSLGGAMLTNS
jgi:hypothetical protein